MRARADELFHLIDRLQAEIALLQAGSEILRRENARLRVRLGAAERTPKRAVIGRIVVHTSGDDGTDQRRNSRNADPAKRALAESNG